MSSHWIQTYTGRQFWSLAPRSQDVDIIDIAHALSRQCRFGGHCREFYSVAQHCCHVADHCPNFPLYGLLHDAAEAYLVDLPQPIKLGLREAGVTVYDDAEKAVMSAIYQALKIDPPTEEAVKEVYEVDILLLATEARDLMAPVHPEWTVGNPNTHLTLREKLEPWSPERAYLEFLFRYAMMRPKFANGFMDLIFQKLRELDERRTHQTVRPRPKRMRGSETATGPGAGSPGGSPAPDPR